MRKNANAALKEAGKWFKEAQFGGMCHWGLYTLLAGEWNGKRPWHPYAEWIQYDGGGFPPAVRI